VRSKSLVIPKLDAFDYATFDGEADSVVFSSWPDPVSNGKLFGRAISEVDDDAVEEKWHRRLPAV